MLARAGDSQDLEQQLGQLLIDYFKRFSSKPACGLDLKLYLPSVGKNETNKFFEEALKLIDLDDKQVPKTVTQPIINSAKICVPVFFTELFSLLTLVVKIYYSECPKT